MLLTFFTTLFRWKGLESIAERISVVLLSREENQETYAKRLQFVI